MAFAPKNRKWFLLFAPALLIYVIMLINKSDYQDPEASSVIQISAKRMPQQKPEKNWRGLSQNETDRLSTLGRILYLEEDPPTSLDTNEKKYEILVWKYGKTIENRHLKHFGNEMIDPLQDCSVHNCDVTYSDDSLKSADLVIFHLHRMKSGEIPSTRGSEGQIWTFLTDESPYHTFLNKNNLADYNGVFNWSMTYRMDSDIPVPYGRTVLRKTPIEEKVIIKKRRDVLVAILGSNCGGTNHRWNYVKELEKHIRVDIYGGCGKLKCAGHFKLDCPSIDSYLFYLAFENSNCDEYVTEKLWWNAFEKNSIPIVMGAPAQNYRKLLPPNSYLHVDDYATPKDLANYIEYLNGTEKYSDFYSWKRDFEVLNEHGYFQSKSYHYCRVCEALNYNDRKEKVYRDLSQFWSVKRDCTPAWDA